MLHWMGDFFNFLSHLDVSLASWVAVYGDWVYALLFLIIFSETGLVVFPFLPGDSLLFAAGALAAHPSHPLDISLLSVLLILAATLGNQLNYFLGRHFGHQLVRLCQPGSLEKTEQFFEVHGSKAIIFARFIPIVRTFVPFVAGISKMKARKFSFYNVLSAVLWVPILLLSGFTLGELPFFQAHFVFALYGIVVISMIPVVFSALRSAR